MQFEIGRIDRWRLVFWDGHDLIDSRSDERALGCVSRPDENFRSSSVSSESKSDEAFGLRQVGTGATDDSPLNALRLSAFDPAARWKVCGVDTNPGKY